MATFDLTEPLPIEVKTTSLGTILIQPWYGLTRNALKKIKEVISSSDKSPRLFMEQFVEVFGKTPFEEAKSKKEAFENGTAIKNAKVLSDDELEMIAGEYINSEIDYLQSYYSKSENRKEKTDTLLKKTDGETNVKYLIRLIRAKIEDEMNSPIAKMVKNYSTSFTDKIQDDLLKANPLSYLGNMSTTATLKNELDREHYFKRQMDLNEPYRRYMEQSNEWLNSQRYIQEQVDSCRRHTEEMYDLLHSKRQLQEEIDQWLEPKRLLQEQLNIWHEPIDYFQNQLNDWMNQQRPLQEQFNDLLKFEIPLQYQTSINDISKEIDNYLRNVIIQIDSGNIKISNNGAISFQGEVFPVSEFADIYYRLLEKTKRIRSPKRLLHFIWNFLKRLKAPVRILLFLFIFPQLNNIITLITTPIYQDIYDAFKGNSRREKINEIKKDVQPEVLKFAEFKEYRFVSAKNLNVRKKPSSKSEIIDDIYFGQVVKLIQKGRHWSLVSYLDEDADVKIEGYVFNRYLEKFNKSR